MRLPLTPTTIGQLVYDTTASVPPLLLLDQDGDGTFEQTLTATSDLGAAESADTRPPVIQIASPQDGRVFAGGVPMAWQATDDLSGVLNEMGIIDNDTPSPLSVANGSTVALPPGEHSLTVLAEDRLGNASQAEVRFTVYPVEWLPPLSTAEPYTAKAGRTVPVKFQVRDLGGGTVRDESIQVQVRDAAGNIVAGPFVFANNPTQGVAILGEGQYHHDLRTTGLASGAYTLQVTFSSPQLGGLVTWTILLQR